MYVLDDYMKDLKEEYHLVVKKAICDYRFNTSKEEHNKLIAMKIFPQHGTLAPIPQYVYNWFLLSVCLIHSLAWM